MCKSLTFAYEIDISDLSTIVEVLAKPHVIDDGGNKLLMLL